MRQTITFDKFIRWALIALAVLAVGFIINALSEVLLPFFIAWLIAYLLYPIDGFPNPAWRSLLSIQLKTSEMGSSMIR